MQTEKKEPLQVRLPVGAGQKLKILAAKRHTSISAIAQEALGFWWERQPERQTEGPLFPGDAAATPIATTPEKTEAPLAKPPKAGAKK